MELFSARNLLFASGGISLIVTQLQASSETTPTFMTTHKLVNNRDKDKLKAKLQLPMTSFLQDLVLKVVVLLTLLQVALRLHRSELAQLAQALLTQLAHLATSHLDLPEDQASHRSLVAPLAIHQAHQLLTQALKDHIQALVLPLHIQVLVLPLPLQTCHHHLTNHHKEASLHKLTLLTQLPDHHKLQTVTTCHHAEDKLV